MSWYVFPEWASNIPGPEKMVLITSEDIFRLYGRIIDAS